MQFGTTEEAGEAQKYLVSTFSANALPSESTTDAMDMDIDVEGGARRRLTRDPYLTPFDPGQCQHCLCNAAFFSGYCVAVTGAFNGCVDLGTDLDNQVSSFGPDQGQRSWMREIRRRHPCVVGGRRVPGVQDFSVSLIDQDGNLNAPFNDIISPYRSALFLFNFFPSSTNNGISSCIWYRIVVDRRSVETSIFCSELLLE
ncbi:hypothetical protein B0H13DRAFT_1857528 [Mycena leptocephala]|nr:hypothetical protein B0H13DRAFT_1857528 [Mycena leptocephala]